MIEPTTDSLINWASDALFDAGMDLRDAAIDWATSHRESLEECSASGCSESEAFIRAMDAFFDRLGDVETAEADERLADVLQLSPGTTAAEDLQ